jgi:hypothetical protein
MTQYQARLTSCGMIVAGIKLLYAHCVYYFASALCFCTASVTSANSHTTYLSHSLVVISYIVDSNKTFIVGITQ